MKFTDWPKDIDEGMNHYESSKATIELADEFLQKQLEAFMRQPDFNKTNASEEDFSFGFIQGCKFSQRFWIEFYEMVIDQSNEDILDRLEKEFIMIRKQ